MPLCALVDPIDINFLQNFDRRVPSTLRVRINFLSNFFVAAPLEKVEFLWRDWFPIIRRVGDQFPNWSEGGGKLLQASKILLPPLSYHLPVHCGRVGAVVRFLRQKPLVAPTLFPCSPPSAAGSRTIKITKKSSRENLTIPFCSIIKISKTARCFGN